MAPERPPGGPPGEDSTQVSVQQQVRSGALVNLLGALAKALHPIFLLIATWLYGPSQVGIFVLGYTLLEMVINFTIGGFRDGVLLYTSRCVHRAEQQNELYQVLANALATVLGLSALVIGFLALGGAALIGRAFGRPELGPALLVLSLSLPALALPHLAIAATKSLMIMRYDALIMGLLRYGSLLGLAVLFRLPGRSLNGLVAACVVSHLLIGVAGLWAFARHFSIRRVLGALRHLHLHRPLLAFALPQNLNLTFVHYSAALDVILLGLLGVPAALIACYATGANLVLQLRQVRMLVSSAFAPVIARFHAEGRHAELKVVFQDLSRWIASVALPLALVLVVFRREILWVHHPSYAAHAEFMAILTLAPLLNCLFGLAGNVVAMTGHSRWNLLNSLVAAAVNTALNLLWIPRLGLVGAALASAVAMAAVTGLEVVEADRLAGVRLRLATLAVPIGAALVAALVILLVGRLPLPGGPVARGAAVGAALCVYAALLWAGRRVPAVDPGRGLERGAG